MPAEGLDWLPHDERAHRRRGRPAGRASASSASASARSGSPAVSRWSAAAWSTSSRRTRELGDDLETSLTTNALGPRAHRAGARGRRARPGQRQPRHGPAARRFHDDHPPRPLRRRARRPRGRPAPPGSAPVKINAVLLRGVNDDQAPELLALGDRRRATSCASSSRCRSTPSTAGAARRWSPPRRSSRTWSGEFVLTPAASRGGARRPSCSSSTAARRRSASSPRSPGRSAATATGSGSPPTARSATACSPARSPTCAPPCAAAPPTRSSPTAGWPRWPASAPGHGIDDPTFLQPDRPMSAIGG